MGLFASIFKSQPLPTVPPLPALPQLPPVPALPPLPSPPVPTERPPEKCRKQPRLYFIILIVLLSLILASLWLPRLLRPFFVSPPDASSNTGDASLDIEIGEISARTSDLQRFLEIQSQNQRQDDQTIISKLDQILTKLSAENKSDSPKGTSSENSTPSQFEGIIGQISVLQRSIDINTAQDPAGFEEVRRKLDDISNLIDRKLSEQKHNITINVPFKTSEPGVKTPDQDKPRNTIGLVNVNTERH